jgi:hypothetical protein
MPSFVRARPRCHLTLAPETLIVLRRVAEAARVAPSRVVDAVIGDLTVQGERDLVAAIEAERGR